MAASVTAPAAAATHPRAVYTRVETTGLLLVGLAPLVMLISALIAGQSLGEEAGFLAVGILVPLLAAGLVWRFGTWAKVVGILAGLAGGMMMFWAAFGLAYPASFADFVPGVMLPLGVILAIAGGATAVLRRRHLEASATRGEARILAAVAAVVALAVVGSAVASILSRSAVDATGAAFTTTMKDFEFTEATYEIPAGTATAIRIHNGDAFVHTFTVPALGIDETVLPGSEKLVELQAPAGEYVLYCKPHSSPDNPDRAAGDMAATIIAR